MTAGGNSLRWLIEKWFGSTSEASNRITRSPRVHSSVGRCVCFESIGAGGAMKIFFFRHDDGSWSVSPPASKKPTFTLN
jgi:hypothetical protein